MVLITCRECRERYHSIDEFLDHECPEEAVDRAVNNLMIRHDN